MSPFVAALRSGRVLLMDGAMGTELQRAGIGPGECYEQWNLTRPDAVRAIHRAYVQAGAECLLTHTFQSHPAALGAHALADDLERINRAAVENARSAGDGRAFVLADIGPLRPGSDPADLQRVMRSLDTADAFLFETWSDLGFWEHALADPDWWRACSPSGKPVLLSFTWAMRPGAPALPTEDIARAAQIARQVPGCVALGTNCGREMDVEDLAEVLNLYRRECDLPLFARPNAGTPTRANGSWVYPRTPQQMAAALPALLEAGAVMVGGCCGTTPKHIAAFRPVIDAWNSRRAGPST